MATNVWREVWNRFKGRGAYPHQLAFLLLNPLRSLIFSPRQLAARLHLTVNSPARDAQHFRCAGLVSVSEFDSAANVFLFDLEEWRPQRNRERSFSVRGDSDNRLGRGPTLRYAQNRLRVMKRADSIHRERTLKVMARS